MEQIASKQKEISIYYTTVNHHFKAYLKNLPIPPLTTPFEINTANQISISAMDQSADTNHNRMEHLSLSDTTIGLKYLAIVSERLGDKLIAEANQASRILPQELETW